jgi:phosphoribosylformimino-5-aminoimidazole carboxamide ribotide isomerase
MQLIPAIDIMQGKCVRLVKGDPSKCKVYSTDPTKIAKHWRDEGADLLHLIDLDAALGIGNNLKTIKKLVQNVSARTQVGGGIHTLERAETLLKLDVFRIIFGTHFVTNPELVEEISQRFGATRVAVALDVKKGKVMVDGWKTSSGRNYLDLARTAEALEVGAIICTSVEMDGTLQGPAIDYIAQLVEAVSVPVIASGGVSTLEDLKVLAQTGVEGTIVGAALYEEKFSLKEALEELKNVS